MKVYELMSLLGSCAANEDVVMSIDGVDENRHIVWVTEAGNGDEVVLSDTEDEE